jgi:hypothetical protein
MQLDVAPETETEALLDRVDAAEVGGGFASPYSIA